MLLKEHLETYTKEQLITEAKSFELKRISGLRKAELIERIVECFCAKDMLRKRLVCLTKEEIELFRRACIEPQEISIHDVIYSMQMYKYWLGGFDKITDRFTVYEEIREIFGEMDDEAFRSEQHKKGWMMKCIKFFIEFYGIAPVEIIYKLYNLRVKDSIEEMITMLWGMPVDIVESCIFPMDGFIQEKAPNHPLYSPRGILIHIPVLENQEMKDLLDQQMNKEFYIPTIQQIEEIYQVGYEKSSLSYTKLKMFFTKTLGMKEEQATSLCLQTWASSYHEETISELTEKLSKMGAILEKDYQIHEFMGLIMEAYNQTRRKENRGYQPNELVQEDMTGGMPTVVPGSSKAAALLQDVAPGLKELGITVDLNGNAQTIPISIYPDGLKGPAIKGEKKVYPNDPCPCGSGKKYKKCCGKR